MPNRSTDPWVWWQLFIDLRPHAFLLTDDFDRGLPVYEYREWALNSKFVLCPIGHFNLDTFRLYEVRCERFHMCCRLSHFDTLKSQVGV
jgi:hypothetical protein